MTRVLFATAALVLTQTVAPPAQAQSRPPAEALARSLQARYQGILDFSADFTHTYQGGVLRQSVTEHGTVAVKKPGMMRWTYNAPERKTFVSDGAKIYSYVPEDRQVIVSSVSADGQATTPVLFLTGRGDIARDFTASYPDDEGPTRAGYLLRLVPRQSEVDYESLTVLLDPVTLQIRELSTTDHQGGQSTFVFRNLKENQGLSDSMFVFKMPRGVDIITDDSASR